MLRRTVSRFWGLALALWALTLAGPGLAHERADEQTLPDAPVRMRVIAPSAQGPWLLQVDNVGEHPVRIAADIRLLQLEVRAPARKRSGRSYASGWARRAALCDGPRAFGLSRRFPARRELMLRPGHGYVEQFDPRLICFGKKAALLVPGARVKARYGWKPNARRGMSTAPFVADTAHEPRHHRPVRRLEAATMVLSHAPAVVVGNDVQGRSQRRRQAGDKRKHGGKHKQSRAHEHGGKHKHGRAHEHGGKRKRGSKRGHDRAREQGGKHGLGRAGKGRLDGSGGKGVRGARSNEPPQPSDPLAARLSLTTSRYSDASRGSAIALSVEAHNVGQRPLFVAVRSRMLSFEVEGPDGIVGCPRKSTFHAVPRDLFRRLHHGKHVHMRVLLAEACPPGTFDRPGLYVATPTLHADANGADYGLVAQTGEVTTGEFGKVGGTHRQDDDATLVRVRRGRLPFYQEPPRQRPSKAPRSN